MAIKNKNIKPHIGVFGRRNVGKSSLINRLVQQNTAIVSQQAGTTTDPVKKSVEIFGIGPCVLIDTAGIDDTGALGALRIEKSIKTIAQIDLAILLSSHNIWGKYEQNLIKEFEYYKLPFVIIHNQSDIEPLQQDKIQYPNKTIDFSCKTDENTDKIINLIKTHMPQTAFTSPSLFQGLVKPKDIILLITPIDTAAPEGRMILPQVMAWRHLLDEDCICISVKDTELDDFLSLNLKPNLVITDSQAFALVANKLPKKIPLTSFSIILARQKGNFKRYIEGTKHIAKLKDGDRILILESCSHQISCEDIGRVKIPLWLKNYTKKDLYFETVSGFSDIKQAIHSYAMLIQCGGCVVTNKQLQNRLQAFAKAGIPISNYGMSIAMVHGIFNRAIAPFEHLL